MHSATFPRLICVVALSCGSRGHAAEVLIDQRTNLVIAAEGSAAEHLSDATELLKKYLPLALRRATLAGPGPTVRIEVTALAPDWTELSAGELEGVTDIDRFEVECKAGTKPEIRITGTYVVSACYGVFDFLERDIGITWLFPGELGVALPDRAEFRVAAGKRRIRPAIASRIMTGLRLRKPGIKTSRDPLQQKHRHFLWSYDYFKSIKLHFMSYASHNMYGLYPPQKYGETDPDIYPLVDGRRYVPPPRKKMKEGKPWHPCYTNPKVVDIAEATAKDYFETRGRHTLSLGINDGRRIQCQCEDCTKLGFPEAYYEYVKKVAKRAERYYPPHMLGLIAYGDVGAPPADLRLPENVFVTISSNRSDHLTVWSKHAQHLGTYEYGYGRGFWVPNFPLKAMVRNAKLYRDYKVHFLHAEMYPIWPFDGPKMYIRSKLMWNPDLDADGALQRYCDAAFGGGGEPMYRYFKRWAALKDDDIAEEGVSPMTNMRMWRRAGQQFSEVTPGDYAYCARCVAEAEELVSDVMDRKRLEMFATFFEHSRALYAIYRFKERVFEPDQEQDWLALLAEAKGLRGRHQQALATIKEHPEWLLGTSQTPDELAAMEHHYSWTLNYEMDNALRMIAMQLGESGAAPDVPPDLVRYLGPSERKQTRFSLLQSHPWWTRRYPKMQASKEGQTVTFSAVPSDPANESLRYPNGGYVSLRTGQLPATGDTLLLVDLDLKGKAGTLEIRLQDRCITGRSVGEMHVRFGEAEETQRRQIVVEPVYLDRETRARAKSVPPDGRAAIEIHILWRPDGEAGAISGVCTVSHADFERSAK